MGNMTLAIPDELARRMKAFAEIRWSEVARQAIERRVTDLEALNKLLSKSKLTKKDVEEISKKIKSSAAKRLNEVSS
jgi:hypothetical protein